MATMSKRDAKKLEDAICNAIDRGYYRTSNREFLAKSKNIPEDDLASNNNSPDDTFFWNGPEEWEIVIQKNGERSIRVIFELPK